MVSKIIVLYGLPGSGKTTYANTRGKALIISGDAMKPFTPEKVAQRISQGINESWRADHEVVILDALIYTPEQLKEVVDAIRAHRGTKHLPIEVVAWEKNVKACLFNDSKRPSKEQCPDTIKTLGKTYRYPTDAELDALGNNISLTRMNVVTNSEYLEWSSKYGITSGGRSGMTDRSNKRFLTSEPWCIGGTQNSYTGDSWAMETEKPPEEFEEFDKLIEQLLPNCTFLQYKRIKRETVTTEQYSDHGDPYVHGVYAYYRCDLEKLEKIVKEIK